MATHVRQIFWVPELARKAGPCRARNNHLALSGCWEAGGWGWRWGVALFGCLSDPCSLPHLTGRCLHTDTVRHWHASPIRYNRMCACVRTTGVLWVLIPLLRWLDNVRMLMFADVCWVWWVGWWDGVGCWLVAWLGAGGDVDCRQPLARPLFLRAPQALPEPLGLYCYVRHR